MLFFFQAEDGIRDLTVTGVQTCALPILIFPATDGIEPFAQVPPSDKNPRIVTVLYLGNLFTEKGVFVLLEAAEIGRASCRERVEISVGAVSLKKKDGVRSARDVREVRTA